MILYFDTETTGLAPGEICELAYIMQSESEIKSKNFFFAVEYVEPQAEKIHGFSVGKLEELSKGKVFGDNLKEIQEDFASADLVVAHNFNFDFMFMNAEFSRYEEQFSYKECLCSMKKFTPICKMQRANNVRYKYPKLTELCEFLDIYTYDITMKTAELFKTYAAQHDARFDTVSLYLAMNEGNKKFTQIKEVFEEYL